MAKLSYSENLEGYQQMSKPAVVSYFNYVSTLLSTWHWLFRQCWNCPMQTGLNKLEKNNFSQWSGIGKYNIFYWWNVPPGRSFICLEYLLFRCWQMYLFVFLVSGWIVELYLLFLISAMSGSFISYLLLSSTTNITDLQSRPTRLPNGAPACGTSDSGQV